MACAICKTRRPRRFCPGVSGDICSVCCGTGREVTIACPLDCPYLQDARLHEKLAPITAEEVPNRDIRVTEELMRDNEELLVCLARALGTTALASPGVADPDVREAIEGLIRTYRTLQSGVYYESLPANPLAANLFREVQAAVSEFRRQEPQRLGMTKTRDSDVLTLLVLLERLELDRQNGRPRGRAFIDTLRRLYPAAEDGSASPLPSPLILP
jgi:hypothetical protein